MDMKNTSRNTGSNSTPYSPKTEEEKEEAYKLWEQFQDELAKVNAFRELVVRHAASNSSKSSPKDKGKNQ